MGWRFGVRFEQPAGLATVIGALPFERPVDASEFVLDAVPQLPSAPSVVLDPDHLDVASLGDDVRAGLTTFFGRLVGRVEPVVLTLTGPITLGLRLRDDGVTDEDALRRSASSVRDVARWLLDRARTDLPGAPVLLFLEEPGLTHSMHPTFPFTSSTVETTVASVVSDLDGGAVVGVQVGGRADWAMLLRTGIAALAAPITAQLDTAASEIGRFLDLGGVIAWGAVPVDEPLGTSPERLWRRLSAVWCELTRLGVDPMLLRERSIITPSGGLATFAPAQAERVVELAQELANRVWRQTVGLRLSIGA
jgi:hypothetical protein